MVEILLSTYNGERYIREQIDSILQQTYVDWHLLVRDDVSTDSTVEIINQYISKYPDKISLLPRDKNLGSMRSFEQLLKSANATYYMFCDQDDVWLPNKIENALSCIRSIETPNIPIVVFSDLQVVDENLHTIHSSFFQNARINTSYLLRKKETLAVNNCAAGCTMLFNNEAKNLSLPFGEKAVMHDAWVLLSVLANNGIIKQIQPADILYRQHGKNVCGAYSVKYNFKYILSKISSLDSVLNVYKAIYLQANEIFGMNIFSFIYQRVKYLCKR